MPVRVGARALSGTAVNEDAPSPLLHGYAWSMTMMDAGRSTTTSTQEVIVVKTFPGLETMSITTSIWSHTHRTV